jgi:hypothetical protein
MILDIEKEKQAFVTNMNLDRLHTRKLSKLYSKRWGIETTYRVTKHDFLAKTTSKNPVVRLFYMLLAVCLYNLWQLANIKIPELPVQKVKKYESTAKIFGALVLGCLRILDTGPPDWLHAPSSGSLAALA